MCLVGYVRTFGARPVFEGITRAIRALGDGVDVYAVVANDRGDTAKGQAAAVPPADVARAKAHLKPKAWVEVSGSASALPPACPACIGQLAKFERCMALIDAAECAGGYRYGWVVKMRPDCVPCRSVPPISSLSLRAGTVLRAPGEDLLIIYPRAVAGAVARGWRRVDCSRLHRVGGGNYTGCNHILDETYRSAGVQTRVGSPQYACDVVRTAEAARSLFEFGKAALHGAARESIRDWPLNRSRYRGSGTNESRTSRFCGRNHADH